MGRKAFLQAFQCNNEIRIPRSELWIGSEVYRGLHIEDNIPSRINLCAQMGMDCIFLPISLENKQSSDYSYRSFLIDDIGKLPASHDMAIAITLDGPFQSLVRKEGMSTVFSLFYDKNKLIDKINAEFETLASSIKRMSSLEFDAILLADDIAYQQKTYFKLEHFQTFLVPFYRKIVDLIHSSYHSALFHSDGNWELFTSALVDCDFDGFSAIQSDCMDLFSLKQNSRKSLMAGIDFSHLITNDFNPTKNNDWLQMIDDLSIDGRLILTSSCGISDVNQLKNLEQIYKWIDNRK